MRAAAEKGTRASSRSADHDQIVSSLGNLLENAVERRISPANPDPAFDFERAQRRHAPIEMRSRPARRLIRAERHVEKRDGNGEPPRDPASDADVRLALLAGGRTDQDAGEGWRT